MSRTREAIAVAVVLLLSSACTYHRAYLIWPVLLTPAFQSAGVEAVAYRVADPTAARAGLYLIPGSEAERLLLAGRIVTEAFARNAP